MNQAFSRWPSPATAGAVDEASTMPTWMLAVPPSRWRGLLGDIAAAGFLVLLPFAFAAVTEWEAFARSDKAAVLFGTAAVAATVVACLTVVQLRRRLHASEKRFDAIFERAGISMWREDWTAAGTAVAALRRAGVSDIEGHFANRTGELREICRKVRITDVNAFTLEEAGTDDKAAYLGPLDRLLPPTDQTFVQWLVAIGRGDRYFRSEAHIKRADGEEVDTLFTAMLPRDLAGFSDVLVTSLDITASRRMQTRLAAAETELARASRVTTVGALGASIAHEVNTPLAAIAANAQAALRWLKREQPDLSEAVAALQDVVIEASRARDVVARTRSFLSNAPLDMTRVDLVQAARDANIFAEREVRANGAVVSLTADADLPMVMGDLVQIQQVFVNLIVNAAQAMAQSPGRKDVTLAMRRDGDKVRVTVSDLGPGIEAAQRTRVFEPFHSTKPNGMGMGLAICRNCIDAHGGDIWVDEAPGGGAAFHVVLPIS